MKSARCSKQSNNLDELLAVIKVKIFSVGKTKEKWLEEAFQEYVKRLSQEISIECLWAKDNEQLVEWVNKERAPLLLDPNGKMQSSEEFSKFFFDQAEKKGSRLTFVIGGPEGLPSDLLKTKEKISFSPMTFTHQMVRLILLEQIYRAVQINKGTLYHK